MESEITIIKKNLRFLKVYALLMTLLFIVMAFSGFTQSTLKQTFEEITAKRVNLTDSNGNVRLRLGGDLNKRGGILFYTDEGTEAGGLLYSGKRDKDGKIDAFALLTMDQFKSDQVVVLAYDHNGDQKRYGLTINDRPDVMSAQADGIIRELAQALRQAEQSGKTSTEIDSLRREYLSRLPARDIVARRLFAGRDVEGSSLVTLSDPDGKPRLRLQVDKLGQASISFLDPSGRTVRTIKP
jgi:hypothetical protein